MSRAAALNLVSLLPKFSDRRPIAEHRKPAFGACSTAAGDFTARSPAAPGTPSLCRLLHLVPDPLLQLARSISPSADARSPEIGAH